MTRSLFQRPNKKAVLPRLEGRRQKCIGLVLIRFWRELNLSLSLFLSDTMHAYKDRTFFIKSLMETCNNSKPIVSQSKCYSLYLNMQLL